MKRIVTACLVIVVFLAAWLVGLGLYQILNPPVAVQPVTQLKIVWNGNELSVNGKKTYFDIPNTESVEVTHSPEVSFGDACTWVKYQVTIRGERPPVLTMEAFEKVQSGMTYPEVGEALGGVMAKGRMSAELCGDIVIVQGKRRITLDFYRGKLAGKLAKGFE